MMSPADWKRFYELERRGISESRARELIDRAPAVNLAPKSALIFPHTRLSESGHLIASVAKGVLQSGSDTVLAIGVLHGLPRNDLRLRGIHGPGAPNDVGIWKDEFSLDSFEYLLSAAAKAAD